MTNLSQNTLALTAPRWQAKNNNSLEELGSELAWDIHNHNVFVCMVCLSVSVYVCIYTIYKYIYYSWAKLPPQKGCGLLTTFSQGLSCRSKVFLWHLGRLPERTATSSNQPTNNHGTYWRPPLPVPLVPVNAQKYQHVVHVVFHVPTKDPCHTAIQVDRVKAPNIGQGSSHWRRSQSRQSQPGVQAVHSLPAGMWRPVWQVGWTNATKRPDTKAGVTCVSFLITVVNTQTAGTWPIFETWRNIGTLVRPGIEKHLETSRGKLQKPTKVWGLIDASRCQDHQILILPRLLENTAVPGHAATEFQTSKESTKESTDHLQTPFAVLCK